MSLTLTLEDRQVRVSGTFPPSARVLHCRAFWRCLGRRRIGTGWWGLLGWPAPFVASHWEPWLSPCAWPTKAVGMATEPCTRTAPTPSRSVSSSPLQILGCRTQIPEITILHSISNVLATLYSTNYILIDMQSNSRNSDSTQLSNCDLIIHSDIFRRCLHIVSVNKWVGRFYDNHFYNLQHFYKFDCCLKHYNNHYVEWNCNHP